MQEWQIIQFNDGYSTYKNGNVSLQEFLYVYKCTCVDDFIDFPDPDVEF